MNRNKKLFANSVLHGLVFLMLAAIFLTLAAILGNSNTAREEAEKQKKNSDLDGSLATVQIYNEETKCWDTYQGVIDLHSGLYGTWLYEINGQEIILTGARNIGSVPAETEQQTFDNTTKGESDNEK